MIRSDSVSSRIRRSNRQAPNFVPAYFAAVLMASVITMIEIGAIAYARQTDIKIDLTWPGIWFALRGGLFFLVIVFKLALLISFAPALLLGGVYRRLDGWSALFAAMMFGTLVALVGWYVLGAVLFRPWHSLLQLHDHISIVAMSLTPGLASGWLFHWMASTTAAGRQTPRVEAQR